MIINGCQSPSWMALTLVLGNEHHTSKKWFYEVIFESGMILTHWDKFSCQRAACQYCSRMLKKTELCVCVQSPLQCQINNDVGINRPSLSFFPVRRVWYTDFCCGRVTCWSQLFCATRHTEGAELMIRLCLWLVGLAQNSSIVLLLWEGRPL